MNVQPANPTKLAMKFVENQTNNNSITASSPSDRSIIFFSQICRSLASLSNTLPTQKHFHLTILYSHPHQPTMLFKIRPLSLVGLFSVLSSVTSQDLDDFTGLIPENCQGTFDGALTCTISNLLSCYGIVDLSGSIAMPDPAAVNCQYLQELSCDVFAACPPCVEQYTGFIDCLKVEVATGDVSVSLRQADVNATGCDDLMMMNATDVDMMNMTDCGNATDIESTIIDVDPELANCPLGPAQCSA